MPFNNLIGRADASALIPEDVSRTIIQSTTETSAVMRLARRAADMPRNQRRLPVLQLLPTAYFVSGDTGLKQTTEMQWGNKYFDAEEIACIVPIPESVLDDQDYDIWAEAQPAIVQAMGAVFDQAVLYGINAPASWPDDIVTAATAAGNVLALGGVGPDLYADLMAPTGLLARVELDGFMTTGHVGALSMRGQLRGVRDANGQPIFQRVMQERGRYELDGEPIEFPRNGAVDAARSLLVSGDYQQLHYCLRQDVTFRIFTEGVITDAAGNVVYNLMQQDMVALRVVMRCAWQVPNPVNPVQPTEASRYPFAVLTP